VALHGKLNAPSVHRLPLPASRQRLPVSPWWKNQISEDQRSSLLQLEMAVEAASTEEELARAKTQLRHATLDALVGQQRQHAARLWHQRNNQRRLQTAEATSYDHLPQDLQSQMQLDSDRGWYRVSQSGASDLFFRQNPDDGHWEWTPDSGDNWSSAGSEIMHGGSFDGNTPVQANIDLIDRLHTIEQGLITLGDQKYHELKFFFRGFISTDMSDGRWMDQSDGCRSAPHEFIGDLPRYPLVNLRGVICFRTDSRGHSTDWGARARFNIKAIMSDTGVDINPQITDDAGETVTSPYSDYTVMYTCKDSMMTTNNCGDVTCKDRSSNSKLHTDNLVCYDGTSWGSSCDANSKLASFHFSGNPSDPCVTAAPAVDFYGGVVLAKDGHVYLDGAIDKFPWFEAGIIADGTPTQLGTWDPAPGTSANALLFSGPNTVIHVATGF